VTFAVEVLPSRDYAREAGARVALQLPGEGSVVLTGGTTAEPVYGALAASDAGWGGIDVYFSDERCVPPDDPASNLGMANRALLERVKARCVHEMRCEADPEAAARAYHDRLVGTGFDLLLLGVGTDCHVAAMFPRSPVLRERSRLCVSIARPDGMRALTLTPPALWEAERVLLLACGSSKAEAVGRTVGGVEPPFDCPARLLADHPDATFLVDEEAAARL
jgi:6-phosphogluconolactonase